MIKFIDIADEHKEILVRNKKEYCTYAWIETDEIKSDKFPITVMDYKPKYSRQNKFVFEEPIWGFMQRERTEEQQKFIDKNIDRLNELFIEFAQSNRFLK